jgi:hypothetical protein
LIDESGAPTAAPHLPSCDAGGATPGGKLCTGAPATTSLGRKALDTMRTDRKMTAGRITGIDPASGASIAVTYADGRIAAIEPAEPGDGAYISAGLVDLQVNGYAGHDLNGAASPEQVVALTTVLRGLGVTTYLPTVITAGQADLIQRLQAIAEARRLDARTARAVPFVHLEGPWISPEDGARGAHPRAHVAEPSLDQFEALQDACGQLIGLVTLSPHTPQSSQFITQLVQRGVRVSIGVPGCPRISATVLRPCCRATPISSGRNWRMIA